MGVSVAIITMGGPRALEACLRAVKAQAGVPALEVVATYDPALEGIEAVAATHPDVRFVENTGQTSPLELAGRAVRETTGEQVLLTKDYCVPRPGWAATLLAELEGPCAAVGGPVVLPDEASATEWAFSFLDFFPFLGETADGAVGRLTVCNAAYRRADLEALDVDWKHAFQESAVHDALARHTGGPLVLNPRARVELVRHVDLQDALHERYALGRVFAAERYRLASAQQRLTYRIGAPALPPLMLSRMASKALPDAALRARFLTSLPPLGAMVLARTWGEWLGYVTGRPPSRS